METAIFAQWLHSDQTLRNARWGSGRGGGEVDIVQLGPNQKAVWAVEAKWSDRFYYKPGELKSLLNFCHAQGLQNAIVTSETVSGARTEKSVRLYFAHASVYCYILGFNIVQGKRATDVTAETSSKDVPTTA